MDQEHKIKIGYNISRLRKRKGWSIGYMVDRLGQVGTLVSKKYLITLERGIANTLPEEVLDGIAELFRLPSWSLSDDDPVQAVSLANLEEALGVAQLSCGVYPRLENMVKARSNTVISVSEWREMLYSLTDDSTLTQLRLFEASQDSSDRRRITMDIPNLRCPECSYPGVAIPGRCPKKFTHWHN